MIRNREYAAQLKRFDGLRWGSISPTDIDLYVEFGNRLMVLGECKYGHAPVPTGQRVGLERLVDAATLAPHRYAALLILHHDTEAGDIDYATTEVVRYRWLHEWKKPRRDIVLVDAIDRLRQFVENATRLRLVKQ
jgi:hypothetical protein